MDIIFAFIFFIASMLAVMATGHSMVVGLLCGLAAFLLLGMRRGFGLGALLKMGAASLKNSWIVIAVMAVIGLMTGAWRVSGTITVFVYYGMSLITPQIFLLLTFLLTCLLSYALGTSFGVVGTAGVIFMALARSGGVDPLVTAGIIMSGIIFGDRCSPVSSSALMVAGITETKIMDNVKLMVKTAFVPFCLSLAFYAFLSVNNPLSRVDAELVRSFEEAFSLSAWAFVPALLILLLPLLRVGVLYAMGASILSSVLVALFVQGVSFAEIIRACIFGYSAEGEGLGRILNGGGLFSMVEVVVILIISCMYSGIFGGTGLLNGLHEKLSALCKRIGRFPLMLIVGAAMGMIFCNQTVATLMCNDFMKKPYADNGAGKQELAIDMENSVIVLPFCVPWCIACSVPLGFMGVGYGAIVYAVYIFLVPLWNLAAALFGRPAVTSA